MIRVVIGALLSTFVMGCAAEAGTSGTDGMSTGGDSAWGAGGGPFGDSSGGSLDNPAGGAESGSGGAAAASGGFSSTGGSSSGGGDGTGGAPPVECQEAIPWNEEEGMFFNPPAPAGTLFLYEGQVWESEGEVSFIWSTMCSPNPEPGHWCVDDLETTFRLAPQCL